MATDHELQVVAAAVAALRDDWPARSVLAHLRREPGLRDRPYRHLVVAAVAVAVDPASKSPGRLTQSGPWWRAAALSTEDATPDPPHPKCGHGNPAGRCKACEQEATDGPPPWWTRRRRVTA